MNALVMANFPIAFLIFAAIVGIPLWLTFRHPSKAPDYTEARAHYRAKAAATPQISDFVPSARVAAVDGLTVARQHLAPRAVPGRRHATGPALRKHAPCTAAPVTAIRSTHPAGATDPGNPQ